MSLPQSGELRKQSYVHIERWAARYPHLVKQLCALAEWLREALDHLEVAIPQVILPDQPQWRHCREHGHECREALFREDSSRPHVITRRPGEVSAGAFRIVPANLCPCIHRRQDNLVLLLISHVTYSAGTLKSAERRWLSRTIQREAFAPYMWTWARQ